MLAIGILAFRWDANCHGEEKADSATLPGYASPAEVFAAFQKGWKQRDGETVYSCLAEPYLDEILLAEWSEEFTPRFPGPHPKKTVSKYVNERRRDELTRQELPLRQSEFASVLAGSIGDKKVAFLELVKNLDETSRGPYTNGTLGEILIDGNRGQGVLKIKDFPRYTCHFVKEKHGWLYGGKTVRADNAAAGWDKSRDQAELPLMPVTAKPWTNKPAATYASPQEVVAALYKALEENNPETAWNCIADEARNKVLALSWTTETAGDPLYIDIPKFHELNFAKSAHGMTTEELTAGTYEALSKSFREPKVVCSAIVKRASEHLQTLPKELRKPPELRSVTEENDQASGIAQINVDSASVEESKKEAAAAGSIKLTFTKSKQGWRIDLPSISRFLKR